MKAAFALFALLAACTQQHSPPSGNQAGGAPAAAKPSAPAPTAFVFDEKNDLIDFHYGWSAEAAAVPQLVDLLRKDMDKVKAELIAGAEGDKAFRSKEGYDFNAYSSTTDYNTAGQSPRLLSLSVEAASYDAWIKYYRPHANTPNTAISYYVKGAVIGFLLDAHIRRLTDGAKSLDDVMRLMRSR